MISFNLLTEKWIPCITDKHEKEYFSLYGFFDNSHKIKELALENPLEEISLLRFLQVFIYRAYKVEKGKKNWNELWEKGFFPQEPLINYISENNLHSRFDIFDKERPFYQAKSYFENLKSKDFQQIIKNQSPATIITDKSSGNNAALLEHSMDENVFTFSKKSLPIYLITAQAYSFGGGGGKNKRSHLAGKIQFWLVEDNIFKSLMMNTIYTSKIFGDYDNDGNVPCWELKYDTKPSQECFPAGLYDYLTWQSRLLYIKTPDEIEKDSLDGKILKFSKYNEHFKILRSQGKYIRAEEDQIFRDPIACLVNNKKGKLYELGFNSEKMVWRDLNLILNIENNADKPPRNFSFIKNNYFKEKYKVKAYGNFNEQAGAIYQAEEQEFWFYPAFLENEKYYSVLNDLLKIANNKALSLKKSIEILIVLIVEEAKIETENVLDKSVKSAMKVLEKLISKIINLKSAVSSTKIEQNYWEKLEIPFYQCLEKISRKDDDDFEDIINEWEKTLNRAAKKAFEAYAENMSHNAKTLKALSLATNYLGINLHKKEKKQ